MILTDLRQGIFTRIKCQELWKLSLNVFGWGVCKLPTSTVYTQDTYSYSFIVLFCNRTMTQHTSILWPRRECFIRWPGLHNHPTSTQLRWFGMTWTTEWRKSSQQVFSICGNSFKTVGKAFQVMLVERMPRVCKAVIKVKVTTLKNLKSKIYFDLFNTFLVTTWFLLCYFIVDVFTIILQC